MGERVMPAPAGPHAPSSIGRDAPESDGGRTSAAVRQSITRRWDGAERP